MRSFLNEIIYSLEGYGDKPTARILSFHQFQGNPKKYTLEIEDLRVDENEDTEIEGAEDETNE